tara:strand:+ start:72 stop:656 length:585 start_codon:yes stop_codon:yes gene_type:complete
MPDPHIIDLPGDDIESAIGKVHAATQSPTAGSANMVTSGGVHDYIEGVVDGSNANGPKITVDSFNQTTTLVDSVDTLATNATDTKIPTALAIKNYVQSQNQITISNIQKTQAEIDPTVTNLDSNATINVTATTTTDATVNVVANTNAQYLVIGRVTTSTGAMYTLFDYFNATSGDVLVNRSNLREIEVNIIRLA